MTKTVSGFSKLSKEEKINWIVETHFSNSEETKRIIKQYWNDDTNLQKLHDEFIENTITNFYLPLGIAPNFIINGKNYSIPFAVEESSVVAAASKSAKFWSDRGGFKTTVINTEKIGQVHFIYQGDKQKLETFFDTIKSKFFLETESITKNMQKRGGGILEVVLRDKTADLENYYQLHATFETKDSMGANFINSCLEQFAKTLKKEAQVFEIFSEEEKDITIVMSILSNYVPNCLVRAEVSCKVEELREKTIENPQEFAEKFVQAVRIAEIEPYRAVTHNKGIMNGIDAVVIATGNDFRAIEAGVHAYASKEGKYSSLSHAKIENGVFTFWMEIPLALGTVGGLTTLHPLVKIALEMLEKPSAQELMQVVAVAGLAQNFAALRSLTTTGIQQGHMKMHLMNILNQFQATEEERKKVVKYFEKNTVSHSSVVDYLAEIRK
ncbi:hydroxymethylglutaryl-CoA reductase, degradative [Flavobacterium columnare NBRC 100251 = ATCC 23463]|uniref:3-hydroxy-3-methylglutaryl coenzyme A reductase n=1 Tax=Flavobacterium columnare (strain ATCC 49512 / CIP 103533 / TG 44/87) TaxID=1041826 RepID=G8X6T9_FLACA|nr:hydroxymethylglutaryl-CoA reductase, degradative [Flavobacterium columnare]AEW85674.1 hydroxymethylglutaryl-CoA reductase, degradative [Flavobacterium columnare ATCC 49512]ANO47390.1 hydroxymethylglutaryl-CoA reductase, degradative [Flavobacterium columnare]APT21957.1 hydroxymethylglutaryl-CoA reductase, degradative [Flavobacterium columnare]MBF6652057.1 hydroxymethylglutaryl-CoA reductase, degradative [Flavobacterium columnare]MBF6655943.1 hydroxymethylglutaryl-CoA reductase, degradative [